ncbi:MAG: hypothetical protein RJA22_316 [Verrucomicrobiota bacterium]|jgi:RND family efflux transporter MFP subunit
MPALAGLAVLALSCSRPQSPGAAPAGRGPDPGAAAPRAVRTAAAATRPMERTVTATGSLLARDQATLSIKVPGRLSRLDVDLGQVVRQGDVLAQVDPQDYELRLRQAQAGVAQARAALGLPLEGTNDVVRTEEASLVRQARAVLDEASKNRDRVQNLAQAGVAAASEVDTANAAYLVALNRYEAGLEEARTRQAALHQRRAELDLAAKQLSDTRLRAPFDGAIQARVASLGEFLATGSPVLLLVRTDPLRLRLEVPERLAAGIQPGQALRLRVEGLPEPVPGQIARVSPAISEPARMLVVEADIPNQGFLRPGLFVRADLVTRQNEPGLAVPAAALVVFAGIEKVLTVREGRAIEKTVVTGRRGPDWVEILSGLQAGDPVVLDPGNLRTGQPVTPAAPAPTPAPASAPARP